MDLDDIVDAWIDHAITQHEVPPPNQSRGHYNITYALTCTFSPLLNIGISCSKYNAKGSQHALSWYQLASKNFQSYKEG